MELLKIASNQGPFHYYHLLSGQDLPIKSHDYIMEFFKHEDRLFINHLSKEYHQNRTDKMYPLQEYIGRNTDASSLLYRSLQKHIIDEAVKSDRGKVVDFTQLKCSNWFSIPEYAVRFLIENETYINYRYCDSLCADEIFLPTLFFESPYANKITNNNMRRIDWSTQKYSRPDVITYSEVDKIIKTQSLFARKFDSDVDHLAIDAI